MGDLAKLTGKELDKVMANVNPVLHAALVRHSVGSARGRVFNSFINPGK